MPVEIRLAPNFQVHIKEKEYLELPTIQLLAAGDNVPHIARINCIVTGTPEELAFQIKKAYKPFDSVTPKISQIGQLEQYPCKLTRPLREPINCTLAVTVEYFDSDALGDPVLSEPRETEASCYLWSPLMDDEEIIEAEAVTIPIETSPYIENQPKKRFPGWLALDFGTSNSTVTLFDPIEVPIAEILPREQEIRLRHRMAEWLSSPPSVA